MSVNPIIDLDSFERFIILDAFQPAIPNQENLIIRIAAMLLGPFVRIHTDIDARIIDEDFIDMDSDDFLVQKLVAEFHAFPLKSNWVHKQIKY